MVEIPYSVCNKYPSVFKAVDEKCEVKARVYLNRFYNEDGIIINEYKQSNSYSRFPSKNISTIIT